MTKNARLILLGLLAVFCSCGGEKSPNEKKDTSEYTTLAQLRDKMTSTSAEFSITIKDLVVTAVYENYVQLEDGSAGAQLNKSGHSLQVGQKINGKISGKARTSSDALALTLLDVSKATVTTTQTLPCQTLDIADIEDNLKDYIHRRVKIEGVTFVNGFAGKANGSAEFSQKGNQVSAVCRPEGIVIADGAQGDIICYPSGSSYYVYDAGDFTERTLTSAITKADTYGVYNIVNNAPVADLVYTVDADQYSFSASTSEREFRLQNYYDEWVLIFKMPAKVKTGMEITLTTSSIGLSTFPDASAQVAVEQISGDKIYLMDYSANKGYVFRITED